MTDSTKLAGLCCLVALVLVVYQAIGIIYNLLFHPLRKYPGPWHWGASRAFLTVSTIRGRYVHQIKDLHRQYGHVVRIAPNELSFTDERAWNDICGATKAAPYGMKKDERLNDLVGGDATNPDLSKEKADMIHTRIRRSLAPAFSRSSVRQQSPLINSHVDEMVAVLSESAKQGQTVDMCRIYAFTMYDSFSDIFLGESMNLLGDPATRPWVDSMVGFAKATTTLAALSHYWVLRLLIGLLLKTMGNGSRDAFMNPCLDRFDRRLQRKDGGGSGRHDLVHLALESSKQQVSAKELRDFSPFLMVGGGETMGSLLPCLTYLLLKHPRAMQRVTREVREAFDGGGGGQDDITMDRVLRLPYLGACIDEALRMYPPVAQGNERVVPEGGAAVCGDHLPGGTIVVVSQLSAYRQKRNFFRPDHFVPERWLPEAGPEFANDRKAVFKPFSVGPQNCFGQEVAHYTLRLVMVRLLLSFKMKLCQESDAKNTWGGQLAVYNVWMKPPLNVELELAGVKG